MQFDDYKVSAISWRCLFATAAAISTCSTAEAHTDILVAVREGVLVTGSTDYQNVSIGERVFAGDLEPYTDPNMYAGVAPGFGALGRQDMLPSGTSLLPALSPLSFSVPAIDVYGGVNGRNLWYWDGNGSLALVAPPAHHRLELAYWPASVAVADGGANDVPGFVIGTTSSTGSLHKHVAFRLFGDNGAMPENGVYVLPLRLSMPGLGDSDPFFVLFGKGVSGAAMLQTREWVQTHLVPEPASFCLLSAVAFSFFATGRFRPRCQD